MEVLNTFFIAPLLDIGSDPIFLLEVIIGGMMAGIMYSLVALGFVLIYKASGVFNYAQGAMVLFAALALVGLMERHVPLVLAIILTMGIMVGLAFLIERFMLRKLVNQAQIILFMAAIGLNFVLEGAGQIAWGSNVKKLDIGKRNLISVFLLKVPVSKGIPRIIFLEVRAVVLKHHHL